MLADDNGGCNAFRHGTALNHESKTNILENLYDFLKEAELQQYFDVINVKLKVRSTAQLKYVDETDLQSIGMTRPEMRRLKKYFAKEFPQTAIGKIKKRLSRTTSARSTSVPRPEDLSQSMNPFAITRFTASVTNFSIASNGTPSEWSCDMSRTTGGVGGSSGSNCKYSGHISQNQLTLGVLLRHGDLADIYKGSFHPGQTQIEVVVKVINKISLKDDGADLVKELSTYSYLDHVNVARLYGLCLDEYSIKMVSQLAPFGSLSDCLQESDARIKYPVTVLHGLVVQVSEAMSYLEERRVIHGRLTVTNVLMFPHNKVKVTDMGLFRAKTGLERGAMVPGHPGMCTDISGTAKESMASDVCFFGVLIWDVFNYCSSSLSCEMDESMYTEMNMRLPHLLQPDLCPNMIFHLMKMCWTNQQSKERPSFHQLSSELVRLDLEQVVAMVDGPDLIPCHRSEETNEPSDDSYSSLTEMQMLFYRTGNVIVVLDRSVNQYKELWRGCLLTGECGYFRWSNTRPVGLREVLPQSTNTKSTQPSPVNSTRSGGRVLGDALAKIHISRREDKRKQGRLSVDMISGPQNDFRHVGHVGINGDVFGDVGPLYEEEAGTKVRSGSASMCSRNDFIEASSIISTTTLNATGEDTPPYATIDSGPGTVHSNKSKDSFTTTKNYREKSKPFRVQGVPPPPPVRSHSEDESNSNIYLDELTIGTNFLPSGNDSFSLFEEMSRQWQIQSSKLDSPTYEIEMLSSSTTQIIGPPPPCPPKSPIPSEDYSEVDEDPSSSRPTYTKSLLESMTESPPLSRAVPCPNGPAPTKTNIFQKIRDYGANKLSSKSKDGLVDGQKSPVYAKVNKTSKIKKDKNHKNKTRVAISHPILVSSPVVTVQEADTIDDCFLDCSSEVSSLQPSPRDSVLCLANSPYSPSFPFTDPSLSFSRQHSSITTSTGSKPRTSDSTITSVSPASSFASLTSTTASNVLQGGAALRALRKGGDCVFRAPSAVKAFNRKRPSVGQILGEQYVSEGTISRTRKPSLPLSSVSVKMTTSAIERHNSLHPRFDRYDHLDSSVEDSSATTPIASELPHLPYIDLSLVRGSVPEKSNTCEEEDAYNSLHSGSLGSDSVERRSCFTKSSDLSYDKGDQNGRPKYSHNHPFNNSNMSGANPSDDEQEVAL